MDIPVRLHLITNDRILSRPDFLSTATAILHSLPHAALHLRVRELSAARLYELAAALRDSNPNLLINDRADIAAAVNAGVQLGVRSLPIQHARSLLGAAATIGYSAHSATEAAKAEADGANFILLGTIYRSESHPELEPVGTRLIADAARSCTIPLVAIGGVTIETVPQVRAAGAVGVAVIRAIWDAADPVQAAAEFAKLLELKT